MKLGFMPKWGTASSKNAKIFVRKIDGDAEEILLVEYIPKWITTKSPAYAKPNFAITQQFCSNSASAGYIRHDLFKT